MSRQKKEISRRGRTQKPPTLFDRFDLEEQFLVAPDSAALKSALIRAKDRDNGDPRIVKYWEKTGTPIDNDLREIWRHEMRQVERVCAYPGAEEVIVELEHGETSDAFYLAMPGELGILDHVREHSRGGHWLHSLGTVRSRAVLWWNLQRLAQALRAVHSQGLIHGHLDGRSIFTASETEPDFRLGGFEWCVRIAEIEKTPVARIAGGPGKPIILSFIDDWRRLGRLFAELLGLDTDTLDTEQPAFAGGRPIIDLDAAELDFVRWINQPERHREIDADVVITKIKLLLAELGLEAGGNSGRYLLGLRLSESSRLSAALCAASGDAFDPDDFASQIRFVEADLATGAELVRTRQSGMALLTETLLYKLRPFSRAGVEPTWQAAICHDAKLRDQSGFPARTSVIMPPHHIEVIRGGAVETRRQELRGDAMDWSALFGEIAEQDDPALIMRRGLLLAQIAEALFRVSAIIPVEIIGESRKASDGQTIFSLVPREDEQRDTLARALKVDSPARLMSRLFKDEEADIDAAWEISESGALGRPGRNNVSVRFVRMAAGRDQRIYEFRSEGPLPPTQQLYLRQAEEGGTEGAIRRRLRMLATLDTQQELSRALANPRYRMRSYSIPLLKDANWNRLDRSKQDALESIWSTGPIQFVVGPPGVGKTRLVTEIVRRVLVTDSTGRLLLSAQAHQALDHLASSVKQSLEDAGYGDDILLVRSKADAGADLPGVQPQDRARQYLTAIDRSPVARGAPLDLRRAVSAMKSASAQQPHKRLADTETHRQCQSFEALLLQCANVLFSTTNSSDLAQLVEDGAQFDWVLVEEAAKATGPELLAPLLLSMRRLLIGDHNQLPPFDTDRVMAFLSNQTSVKEAVALSEPLIGNIFRDFGLDDLLEAVGDDSALASTCEAARRSVLFFETAVIRELERQEKMAAGRKRVATELREQHRMHPVIATVIAESFYPGKDRLITAPGSAEMFSQDDPPFRFEDESIPDSPIVVLDMPYVQKQKGAAEELPLYHNGAERSAVLAVLNRLRTQPTKPGKPTLAILSPYKEQVARISLDIEDGLSGALSHLDGFASATRSGQFVGTVDSFQGSEADLVVISLVRNNDHVGTRALGFLSDRRRMNVLLSRAKWKLVLVTSLDFLRTQSRTYGKSRSPQPPRSAFMGTFISVLDRLTKERLPSGVPAASIVPFHSSNGGTL